MMTKQKEKSQQTKHELMKAANELFVEKGFIETTIAQITSKAGYAKGNFYRHWPSKDKLFLEIIENKLNDYRSKRDNKLKTATSLEEVMNIIWDFLESIITDHNWARIFLEFTIYASRNDQLKNDLSLSQYRLSESVFADIVKDYIETDYPAKKLGAFNTMLFEGFMIQNALETGIVDLADVRNAAITVALANGLKK